MLALPLLAAAATPAAPSLTPSQQREVARLFICPAHLPDDAARIAALDRFIKRFAELAPSSRPAEQLAFHRALERRNKCPELEEQLIRTVPEE